MKKTLDEELKDILDNLYEFPDKKVEVDGQEYVHLSRLDIYKAVDELKSLFSQKLDVAKRAMELLLKAQPESMKMNGQEVVIITQIAYEQLVSILSQQDEEIT